MRSLLRRVHALIALVVERSSRSGRIRLTKLLYLIDEARYARFGVTLTGATWVRYTYVREVRIPHP